MQVGKTEMLQFLQRKSYSFYLVGNVTLTATYQNAGQEVVQSPGAMLSNVLFKETTAGKYRVSFVCQLSMPEGYELQEAGVSGQRRI